MKILVFGAGVLGCNLARNLFRAGKDVTDARTEKLVRFHSLFRFSDDAM